MKRLITAVSFAVLAVPAFAGAPYDQNEVDRALPQIEENASAGASSTRAERLPYDQNQVDRALPQIEKKSSERTSAAQRAVPFEQAELDRTTPVL
jgi:hypothetical protein